MSVNYFKQLAYETIIVVPGNSCGIDSGEVSIPLTDELFNQIITNVKDFKEKGINIPVTKNHYDTSIDNTVGYIKGVWKQKDKKGRPSLFAYIQFDNQPDDTILNAGISLESPALYTATDGTTYIHPLLSATVTPTPVINDMSGYDLALSITFGDQGLFASQGGGAESRQLSGHSAPTTTIKPMNEQLLTLLFQALGVNPTDYEGKDNELIEAVSKMFAELLAGRSELETLKADKAEADQTIAEVKEDPTVVVTEGTPHQVTTPVADPTPTVVANDDGGIDVEIKDGDSDEVKALKENLALAQNNLAKQSQEMRTAKLNELVQNGKITKPMYDKLKGIYGGNLALSRNKEFNDVMQVLDMNKVTTTLSQVQQQIAPITKGGEANGGIFSKIAEQRYGNK